MLSRSSFLESICLRLPKRWEPNRSSLPMHEKPVRVFESLQANEWQEEHECQHRKDSPWPGERACHDHWLPRRWCCQAGQASQVNGWPGRPFYRSVQLQHNNRGYHSERLNCLERFREQLLWTDPYRYVSRLRAHIPGEAHSFRARSRKVDPLLPVRENHQSWQRSPYFSSI